MDKQAIIDKAAVLLDYIATGVEKGGEFVAEQAPLLAQEILSYGLAYHSVWGVVTAVTLIVSTWLFIHSFGELKKNNDDWVGGLIISVVGFGGSLIFTIVNTLYILKLTYAPRLYLLEVIKGLV